MKIAKHRKENKVQGRKQVDHRERKRNPNHPSFLPLLSSSLLYQSSAFHSVLGWSLPFAFPLYHLKTNTKLHTIFNTPTTLSSPTITLSLAPTPLLFFSFLFFRLPPHNLFMAASPWPHSASLLNHILLFIATLLIQQQGGVVMVEATSSWCVARSDASYQALQTALDYACWAGADCTPIQSDGLCFLPNTIQAHASYAFNSYYQRKGMAPGSCDFSGSANIARTDPSYGSCVYPSSLSAAGGAATPTMPTTNPNSFTPPVTTTTTPTTITDLSPPLPTDNSKASIRSMDIAMLLPAAFVLLLLFSF